jgi:hypothetical protein
MTSTHQLVAAIALAVTATACAAEDATENDDAVAVDVAPAQTQPLCDSPGHCSQYQPPPPPPPCTFQLIWIGGIPQSTCMS